MLYIAFAQVTMHGLHQNHEARIIAISGGDLLIHALLPSLNQMRTSKQLAAWIQRLGFKGILKRAKPSWRSYPVPCKLP